MIRFWGWEVSCVFPCLITYLLWSNTALWIEWRNGDVLFCAPRSYSSSEEDEEERHKHKRKKSKSHKKKDKKKREKEKRHKKKHKSKESSSDSSTSSSGTDWQTLYLCVFNSHSLKYTTICDLDPFTTSCQLSLWRLTGKQHLNIQTFLYVNSTDVCFFFLFSSWLTKIDDKICFKFPLQYSLFLWKLLWGCVTMFCIKVKY